jgi:hypothetical protein
MRFRTYTNILQTGVIAAAGGNGSSYFDIMNPNKRMKLRSFLWTLNIRNPGAPITVISNYNRSTVEVQTSISSTPSQSTFSYLTSDTTPPGMLYANGNNITLYDPGQFIFNSLDFQSTVRVNFSYENNDPLLTYRFISCYVIEVEEIE